MSADVLESTASGAELPADVDTCHAWIRDLMEMVIKKDTDISALKERLQWLLREKFGKKSEKISPDQMSLFAAQLGALLESEQSIVEADGEKKEEGKKSSSARRGGGGRTETAEHVRRERRDYHPNPDDLLCNCGRTKTEFGTYSMDQLDFIPASFVVIEHVTHKYACKSCTASVVEGQRPNQIHNGGKPAEGLIAHISTSKYADHSPLERQEDIYAREGVHVPASSMGRWLEQSAHELGKVTDLMHEKLLECAVLQADESPYDLIDLNRAGKKIKKGYVWTLFGDAHAPYVYFQFQADRTGETAQKLIKGFSGFLVTDGYGGYDWYRADRSANCNVHSRRYFEKALKCDKKKAGAMLALYSKLYKIEEAIKGKSEQEILLARQEQSLPIVNQMHTLLQSWQLTEAPKTSLGVAINYALSRWDQLMLFTKHAVIPLDTNLVENAIRAIAIGRKNWLKIGGEGGLRTATVHATLVNTCKRLGINPYLYLRDVLIRLGAGTDPIDDLLPDRWQLKHDPRAQPPDQTASTAASVA